MGTQQDRAEHLVNSQLHTLTRAEREATFRTLLSAPVINLKNLRRISREGVPSGQGLRAQTWQLLLQYLPVERECWAGQLVLRRKQYAEFCQDFSVRPSDKATSRNDHPLSVDEDSAFHQHFQDMEVMEQIDRDVERTHSDLPFFGGESEQSGIHREEVKRALFIFAKLNSGLKYVQGMNEMIAPLYMLFKLDAATPEDAAAAEADSFFCFVNLMNMTENRDLYCKSLDQSDTGVKMTLSRLMRRVAEADPSIAAHLVKQKVDPQYFAFRWITCLFCQDIEDMASILRVWDYLLGDDEGCSDALMRLCTAMLLNRRTQILATEFPEVIKVLQNCGKGDFDVETVINMAASLSRTYLL